MDRSKFIIGTGSWGSKINFDQAMILGNKLILMGLNHFDTAPNYGSGYSHYILNYLAKNNTVLIDTKYGQDIKLSIKEILKRIYRFKNFKSLNNSLKYIKFVNFNRTDKKFWSIEKLNEFLDSITKDLKYCKIKTIYLHCPPYGILNEDYLNNFTNLLAQKNITPGISGPNIKDLELIVKNFPLIKLQLSLNTFWNEKTKIVNKTVNVNINSILKTLHENKTKNLNYNIDFLENFEKILNENKHYNIILGINSLNSIEKLSSILLNFKNIKK